MRNDYGKRGISNTIFGTVAIVLIVTTAAGFALYATSSRTLTTISTQTVTVMSTESMSQAATQTMASSGEPTTDSYAFKPNSGAMISNGYLVIASIGMHQYAIAIHAEGLEHNGIYAVEATLSAGSMQMVLISSQSMSMNTTSASEFQANANGTGLYWIEIESNPNTNFESVELYFLPEMSMQNATLVATAMMGMMTETTIASTT